jgi:predicted amino acid racemase
MANDRDKYPRLTVHYPKLYHNCKSVVEECAKRGIRVAGVFKGFNGIPDGVKTMIAAGCSQVATSRLDQIASLRQAGIDAEYLLVRIPMLSEIESLVRYADCSLNSEWAVVEAIGEECAVQGKTHGVILMADLGDLREGFWERRELYDLAAHIEYDLSNVNLLGVGTNLGCYGSIKPTYEKLQELCEIAQDIEAAIGRKLDIVSGGATSSYPLVLNDDIPDCVNHLRIGEGIILAYDLQSLWGLDMSDLFQDVFVFKAEIVEIKDKPTYPVGEIFIDGFGRSPEYEDRGMRKRAILAAGKLDYALNDKIFPRLKGIEVIGGSSDHTIIDVEDCEEDLAVGDVLEFYLSYPSLMYLTNSPYITIEGEYGE